MTVTLETSTATTEPKPVVQLETATITPIKTRKTRAPKHDFKDGSGRVFAHKHDHGGGWIADTAKVDATVYVGPRCEVFQHARVHDRVRLEGRAKVFGTSVVRDSVLLRQESAIFGAAYVCDTTVLNDFARVSGSAHVSGTSRIEGQAAVTDSARVVASTLVNLVRVSGGAMVVRSHLSNEVKAYGNCFISYSTLYGTIDVYEFCQCLNLRATVRRRTPSGRGAHFCGHALLVDNCHVNQNITVSDHAILIRAIFYDNGDPAEDYATINSNLLLAHTTFHNRSSLQAHLTTMRENSRAGARTGILPVGPAAIAAAAGAATTRPNYLADISRNGRRIMTLQESDA